MKGRPGLVAYVVTLSRRGDRRRLLETCADRESIRLRFNTDLGLDVDARTIEPSALLLSLFPWELAGSHNKWWRRPLKMGEIACSLAHLAIWQAIASLPEGFVLVFEDDAVVPPGFREGLDEAIDELAGHDPEWEFLYLARRRWGADSEIGLRRIVSPGYSACLHGYALTPKGAAKLVAGNLEGRMMPVDEFVPASIAPHPREDVAAAVRPVLRGYACRDDLMSVLPKDIWGSETEETGFVHSWPGPADGSGR